MSPREAFLRYAEGAFRVEPDAAYLSDNNESLYQGFVDSLQGVADADALVELLAMETPVKSRDVRYELWVAVLQRLRDLLGGDRDAMIAEILVHIIYGEYDEAGPAWEHAHDIYPGDPEVLRAGMLTAAVNRDTEAFRLCLDQLRCDCIDPDTLSSELRLLGRAC